MTRSRKGDSRPTINDVAARAGFSKATVSKALNLPPETSPVSETTRLKIIQVAAEMRYQPDWRAKALAGGSSRIVGLLYDYFPSLMGIYEPMSHAFARTLQQNDYHLLFLPVAGDEEWSRSVMHQRIDAAAVFNHISDAVRGILEQRHLPAILLNVESDLPYSHILVDDRDGAMQATRHLLELGHQRIAFLRGNYAEPHYSQAQREEGFLQAMQERGLANAAQVMEVSVEEFADIIRQGGACPTAVLTYDHRLAITLLEALWRRGLQVPHDLSVVAFNDLHLVAHLIPPLTTVAVPAWQMGTLAAETLVHQLHTGEVPQERKIILCAELIVRNSTAPPA